MRDPSAAFLQRRDTQLLTTHRRLLAQVDEAEQRLARSFFVEYDHGDAMRHLRAQRGRLNLFLHQHGIEVGQ